MGLRSIRAMIFGVTHSDTCFIGVARAARSATGFVGACTPASATHAAHQEKSMANVLKYQLVVPLARDEPGEKGRT